MDDQNLAQQALIEMSKEVAKDLYNDTTKPTAKNVGGFFGTLAGFFNHVVVYPLKKLNIEYEQKAIAFQKEMEEKYNKIPVENRCEPKLSVVGPALESLKYNMLEDDIRDMFKNLLVNSMDDRFDSSFSSAYVKIIDQMSGLDAKLLSVLHSECFRLKSISYITPKFTYINKKGEREFIIAQKYFTEDLGMPYTIGEISASLANLNRLGLLSMSSQYILTKTATEKILNRKEVHEERKMMEEILKGATDIEMKVNYSGIIEFSDFANGFAKICFG